MKYFLFTALIVTCCSGKATEFKECPNVQPAKALIDREFKSTIEFTDFHLDTDGECSHMVESDFNSDGNTDLAIMVYVKSFDSKLTKTGVIIVDEQGLKTGPESFRMKNWAGVVLFHGKKGGWQKGTTAKFMRYASFSGIHKALAEELKKISSSPKTPSPKNGIVLDMETGARDLVFWDGKTYKSQNIHAGD